LRTILSAVIVLALLTPVLNGQTSGHEMPLILVYSGSMVDWASAICEILDEDDRISGECLVVPDRDLLSIMLFLPRTQALVLAPMASRDLDGISSMAIDFFEDGGAVVGFSPCTDIRSEPELASSVFPFYCNKSTGSERVDNRQVNTYVAREVEGGIAEDLPPSFRLVSSGFLFATSPGGEVIEIEPDAGTRYVFWEEKNTGAPLVIGYSRPGSGRSVGFSALRINEVSRSNTYFGALTEQEDFLQLLGNVVLWTLQGSERYERLEGSWQALLQLEGGRREKILAEADDKRARVSTRRNLILAGVWVLAVTICVLSFWKLSLVR
jgi:hypothetical protein